MKKQFALLATASLVLAACSTIPQAANSSQYKALGTEPFWSLEIRDNRMIFSRAGEKDITVTGVESRPSINGWRHVSKTITADISFTPCSDGMSDRTYKDTVTVMVGKDSYSGCGGGVAVLQSLEQTNWRIVSIGGVAIAPERQAMLSFADGRASGTIGCNRLGAPYTFKGTSLSFGPVMSTKMGCPDPVAAQEFTLTNMLSTLKSTGFSDDGSMILTGQDGTTVVLQQSI